ncbi:MAG: hypothetical protein LLG05_08755 [Porphyromonadaceae bacterium]|nr:hypothetical protein [Porphyromonadaceae bacterium]
MKPNHELQQFKYRISGKQKQFDVLNKSLHQLEVATNNFGIRFIKDDAVRCKYNKLAKQMAEDISYEVSSGKISPLQGAEKAQTARNLIMEQIRKITSDLGRAKSKALKPHGRSLGELEEIYASKLFNKSFNALSEGERNQVWLMIVARSGKPDEAVNMKVRKFGRAGRLFLVFTISVAVYNVASADDKTTAAAREGTALSGGFLGGAAGGALAGLACGPGAPVCVTIGVFVGGALGAFGAESFFDFCADSAYDNDEFVVGP